MDLSHNSGTLFGLFLRHKTSTRLVDAEIHLQILGRIKANHTTFITQVWPQTSTRNTVDSSEV